MELCQNEPRITGRYDVPKIVADRCEHKYVLIKLHRKGWIEKYRADEEQDKSG